MVFGKRVLQILVPTVRMVFPGSNHGILRANFHLLQRVQGYLLVCIPSALRDCERRDGLCVRNVARKDSFDQVVSQKNLGGVYWWHVQHICDCIHRKIFIHLNLNS